MVRRENGIVELVCKHGTGHPAPGSVHWHEMHGSTHAGVHGCCGCCQTPEWKLKAATQSYEVANRKLRAVIDHQQRRATARFHQNPLSSRDIEAECQRLRDEIGALHEYLIQNNDRAWLTVPSILTHVTPNDKESTVSLCLGRATPS